MGHLVGKDLYRQLGQKIDGLTVRAPWSESLRAVLEELYSKEDAELICKMPYSLSSLGRLRQVTGLPGAELQRRLDSLCDRGLVLDVCLKGQYGYLPAPMVIGIFEFTMMRTDAGLDRKTVARLFHDYMDTDGSFFRANFGSNEQISIMRSVPHEGSVRPEEHVEVLDYEKASAIIEETERFAVGICSCRHEQEHLGHRECQVPLELCSTLGPVAVDYVVRHHFGREISKSEMRENLARARELGLVINADNVQRNVSFFCLCCGCCCGVLQGITRHGYPNIVVTSSYVATSDRDRCKGCGVCSKRCPVEAISREADPDPRFRKHGRPRIDEPLCLGCGVCTLTCKSGAMQLTKRAQRVLHPETTFERTILQCLERGTLQNQLFDHPASRTHRYLRGLVGGFLRLSPVKQALMSDLLRSRFLDALKRVAQRGGRGAVTEL